MKLFPAWKVSVFSGPYFPAIGLSTPYLSVLGPNAEKYGPKKLRIRTLFTQWLSSSYFWRQREMTKTFSNHFFGGSSDRILLNCTFLWIRYIYIIVSFFVLHNCISQCFFRLHQICTRQKRENRFFYLI